MQEGTGKDRRLYNAVVQEDLNVVRQLTRNGVVPEQWAYARREEPFLECLSPLDMAIHIGNRKIIKALLQAEADTKWINTCYR